MSSVPRTMTIQWLWQQPQKRTPVNNQAWLGKKGFASTPDSVSNFSNERYQKRTDKENWPRGRRNKRCQRSLGLSIDVFFSTVRCPFGNSFRFEIQWDAFISPNWKLVSGRKFLLWVVYVLFWPTRDRCISSPLFWPAEIGVARWLMRTMSP